MAELVVDDVTVRYGRAEALRGVSLVAPAGAVTSVVGPNGAGKTTLLNMIGGLLSPAAGVVRLDGRKITGIPPSKLFRTGVALVPEGKRVFHTLTVDENLRLAAAPFGARHQAEVDRCFEMFPRLRERRRVRAALLSGGEQQQLMISRGLIARPRFLLMDEPSIGLAPLIVREVLQVAKQLATEGVGVVLVEQFVQEAAHISDTVYILARGQIRDHMTGAEAAVALASETFFATYAGRDPVAASAPTPTSGES